MCPRSKANGPLEQEGVPKSRSNAIPLETAMGPWSQLEPQIKRPMEQVAAPDKNQMGPLNQVALWRPPETMGLKFESLWVSCSYLGGAPDQTFSFFSFFYFVKWGLSQKNSGPNPKSFWFWRGVTLGPPQTSAPPPPGQILATCLA